MKNWRIKTDRLGKETKAAVDRQKKYFDEYIKDRGISKGCLVDHESRSNFGYNYLEYSPFPKIEEEKFRLFMKYGLTNGWEAEELS